MGIELNQNKYPRMKTSKNTSNGNPLQLDTQPEFMQQLQTVISQQIAQKEHQLAVEYLIGEGGLNKNDREKGTFRTDFAPKFILKLKMLSKYSRYSK